MAELIEIKVFLNRHEAELAKGLLSGQGIKVIISADDAGGYRHHLVFGMGGVRLLVRKEDAEKAKEVLKVLEDSEEQK